MGWDSIAKGVELPFDESITIPELHEVAIETLELTCERLELE